MWDDRLYGGTGVHLTWLPPCGCSEAPLRFATCSSLWSTQVLGLTGNATDVDVLRACANRGGPPAMLLAEAAQVRLCRYRFPLPAT
jgi:hypothetical protein